MTIQERKYQLTCLICGHREDGLVVMQDHAVAKHGYRTADHWHATKRIVEYGYVWTMPDGRDWLEARHLMVLSGGPK